MNMYPSSPPSVAAIETMLVQLAKEMLGVQNVSATDDFYSFGGASLAAVLLALQIEERFGIEFPISQVFDARSLSELAARVDDVLHDRKPPWRK